MTRIYHVTVQHRVTDVFEVAATSRQTAAALVGSRIYAAPGHEPVKPEGLVAHTDDIVAIRTEVVDDPFLDLVDDPSAEPICPSETSAAVAPFTKCVQGPDDLGDGDPFAEPI